MSFRICFEHERWRLIEFICHSDPCINLNTASAEQYKIVFDENFIKGSLAPQGKPFAVLLITSYVTSRDFLSCY